MNSKDIREQRHKLIVDNRALLDLADKEKRKLTADEEQQYDKRMDDICALKDEADRLERQEELERENAGLDEAEPRDDDHPDFEQRSHQPGTATREDLVFDEDEWHEEILKRHFPWDNKQYARDFYRYMVHGTQTPNLRNLLDNDVQYRALQADADIYGGYAVAPQQLVGEIIKAKDNYVFARRLGRTFYLPKAASLGVVSWDNDPADPAWTAEIGTASEDSTASLGKRELTPHQLTKYIKVSNKLLRSSFLNLPAFIAERLGYKFAVTEENCFLNGTGNQQPLGVFTASADGITTSQDVTCSNHQTPTTNFNVDDLKDLKYNLPAQYRGPQCAWVVHRDFVLMASKLKDGNSNYVWTDSIVQGDPDRLLGYPVYESEYAPSTFTTGLYIACFGDWSRYWIVDALNLNIQRLNELYALTNQVAFIGRAETDGMPVEAAAFRRLKLG